MNEDYIDLKNQPEPMNTTLELPPFAEAGQHNESDSHHLQDNNIYLPLNPITTPPLLCETSKSGITLDDKPSFTCLNKVEHIVNGGLDHSSLATLLNHLNGLSQHCALNIGGLHHKLTGTPRKYSYENYPDQCSLIAMLEYDVARTICWCGLKPKKGFIANPTGLCNKPRLCWVCAASRARKSIDTFSPRFHHHQWGLLTISFHGSLPLGYTSGNEWLLHWDAAKYGLKRLVKTEMVKGGMWREELAILTLLPTTLQPHVHAIVSASELSEAAIGCLSSWVQSHRDDLGLGVELAPSINFQRLPTQDDFERALRYLHKPLDLVTPYRARWSDYDPLDEKAAINREMRDLMEAFLSNTQGRSQIGYYGNMRAASKSIFIGVEAVHR